MGHSRRRMYSNEEGIVRGQTRRGHELISEEGGYKEEDVDKARIERRKWTEKKRNQ